MILELLLVAAITVAAGVGCALVVRRLPRFSQQMLAVSLFSVLAPLVAVASTGAVMLSGHDAVGVGVVSLSAAVSASVCGLLLARQVAEPVRDVHDAALALAAGDLSARADLRGPQEARDLAAAFNEMADSVQRTFDARRDLVAWASHDLRTPVSALLAMVEAIEDGVGPAERYLPQIADSTRHLRRLVEDLFDLARAEQPPLAAQEIDANHVAEQAVRTHRPAASDLDLRLSSDLPRTEVRFAELDLTRVLDNLLDNACRYATSAVTVHVGREGTITVADDGPGFPTGDLARVFEPFWRADVTQEHRGAGLGLAIAHRLTERNGATLTASNDRGAIVSVNARLAYPSASLPTSRSR